MMLDPKTADRNISSLNIGMMDYPIRLGRLVAKDELFRKLGINADTIETFRTFERSCYLWGFGRTEQDFSLIGLGSRSHYAQPYESKRSWLSHPKYSTHSHGVAFDMALGFLYGTKISKFIWSKEFNGAAVYQRLSELADSIGLKSFEKTYGMDSFHFEMPISYQGSYELCFGFVVINALQKISSEWRNMDKQVLFNLAVKLGKEIENRGVARSPISALEIAKEWGWVKRFEVIETKKVQKESFWKNLNEKRAVIISQRFNLGLKPLENNNGIPAHTYLFHAWDKRLNNRALFRNSHYNAPIMGFDKYDNIINCVELYS